ncbi:unnamed protein product [Brassica oleracea]
MTDVESSDREAIVQLFASQISDKLSSSSRDICQEISLFEIRLEKAIHARGGRSGTRSGLGRMKKIERKLATVVVDNLMQSAIIKAVTDSIGIPKPSGVSFGEPSGVDIRKELPPIGINNPVQPNPNNNTPSELADSRINEVLVELNGLSDAHQATVQEKELLVPVNTSQLQSAVEGNNAVDQVNLLISGQVRACNWRTVNYMDLLICNNLKVLNDTISVDSTPSDPTSEELEMDELLRLSTPDQMQIPYYLLDMPSFSLGLSQEDAPVAATEKITPLSYVSHAKEPIEEAPELRKSKSSRIMPDGLQDYKCDLKVTENLPLIPDLEVRFKLMEETVLNGPVVILRNGYGVTPGEICDIAHRSSSLPSWVMDTLIELVSRGQANAPNVGIYDTRLPAALMNHHSRFLNTALKDRVKLKFTDVPLEKAKKKLPERIYFQFNMDKQHWVGVCIDTKAYSLQVLDCNTSFHTDSLLKKELNPIANLIPYVLKSLGYLENNAGVKAFTVSRCKGIPQISSQTDAAVMTVLLIQAHICEGICGCKAITPHFLPDAAKQLAVKLHENITM